MRDSKDWDEFLDVRGAIKTLEYFLEFPNFIGEMRDSKKDEEQNARRK